MNLSETKKPIHLVILVILLWSLSSLIGFLLILPILDTIITIYAAFWADTDFLGQAYYLGVTIRQFGAMFLGVVLVIGIIGSGEYHTKHFNTPKSWHLMFITYALLLTLFLFTLFF